MNDFATSYAEKLPHKIKITNWFNGFCKIDNKFCEIDKSWRFILELPHALMNGIFSMTFCHSTTHAFKIQSHYWQQQQQQLRWRFEWQIFSRVSIVPSLKGSPSKVDKCIEFAHNNEILSLNSLNCFNYCLDDTRTWSGSAKISRS